MSMEEILRESFVAIKTDATFSEAVVTLRDRSVLCFRHRVGERRAKAIGPDGDDGGQADEFLEAIQMFRLNAKHLEIFFTDGSIWEWVPDSE